MAGDRKRTDGIYAAVEAASRAAEAVLHMRHSHFLCAGQKNKRRLYTPSAGEIWVFFVRKILDKAEEIVYINIVHAVLGGVCL